MSLKQINLLLDDSEDIVVARDMQALERLMNGR